MKKAFLAIALLFIFTSTASAFTLTPKDCSMLSEILGVINKVVEPEKRKITKDISEILNDPNKTKAEKAELLSSYREYKKKLLGSEFDFSDDGRFLTIPVKRENITAFFVDSNLKKATVVFNLIGGYKVTYELDFFKIQNPSVFYWTISHTYTDFPQYTNYILMQTDINTCNAKILDAEILYLKDKGEYKTKKELISLLERRFQKITPPDVQLMDMANLLFSLPERLLKQKMYKGAE